MHPKIINPALSGKLSLGIMLVFATLQGCGKSAPPPPPGTEAQSPAPASPPAADTAPAAQPPAASSNTATYAPEVEAEFRRGQLALEQGKWQEALEANSAVLEKVPTHVQALLHRALALSRINNLKMAEKDLLEAQRLQPQNPEIVINLACIYSLRDDNDKAIASLKQALQLGFNRRDFLEKDPDLAKVRQDPRFAALLAGATTQP